MAYVRFFMPLESEAHGYDFKGRTPMGRCVLESRGDAGKISVHAQDLRGQTRYGVYLVFADGGRFSGVFVGNLNVDARGKAELRKDFSVGEIAFPLKELAAVAVIATDVTTSVVSPLCGYRERTVSWRGGFSVWEREAVEEAAEETVPEVVAEVAVEVPAEPVEEISAEIVVECAPEIPSDVVVECAPEIPSEIVAEAAPEITSAPVDEIPPEPIEEASPEISCAPVEEIPPRQTAAPRAKKARVAPRAKRPAAESKATHTRSENISALESIIASKSPKCPFAASAIDAVWAELTIADPVPLPHNRPRLLEEPFVRAAYANYDHLILGLAADRSEYFIGVPGEFSPDYRPQAKRLGFSAFKTSDGNTPKRGDFGYWLMNIKI